jgi:undecaprenyl-diphosphatase
MNWNYYLFNEINGLVGKSIILDNLGIFLAQYLAYILIAFSFLYILYRILKYWDWKAFWLISLSVLLGRLVIVEIVRLIYYNPRPFILFPEIQTLINHSNSSSIPSGHATSFFALSIAIYFLNKKLGIAIFILSFLMGIARIFVGVHYPLDILTGILIGILSGIFVLNILKRFFKKE